MSKAVEPYVEASCRECDQLYDCLKHTMEDPYAVFELNDHDTYGSTREFISDVIEADGGIEWAHVLARLGQDKQEGVVLDAWRSNTGEPLTSAVEGGCTMTFPKPPDSASIN